MPDVQPAHDQHDDSSRPGSTPARSPWHRRPVIQALGAGVVGTAGAAVVGVARAGAPAHDRLDPADARVGRVLTRHHHGKDETRLVASDFEKKGDGRWRSPVVEIASTTLVAATWPADDPTPHVRVRTRRHGSWQPWQHLAELLDRPDGDTDEGRAGRGGTQPLWLHGVRHVQLLVHGDQPPPELTLVAIEARTRPADRVVVPPSQPDARRTPGVPPEPTVLTRSQWGADPTWRSGTPRYCSTIQQVHVHHTDTGNDYGRDDVPSILRAIYRYHTKSLGWSDIGYNFLVDKFGRLWEGRAGGIARPVLGAHTLGFNDTSCGVSMIGTYTSQQPTDGALTRIVELAAWKLALYGRTATAHTTVVSQGSDRFGPGRKVMLPVIDGHRDTNQTQCPGNDLYAHLPAIRTRAQSRIDSAGQPSGPVSITGAFALTGNPTPGHRLVVEPGTYSPSSSRVAYAWYRGSTRVTSATGAVYALSSADIGQRIAVVVGVGEAGGSTASQTLALPVPVKSPSSLHLSIATSGTTSTLTAQVVPQSTAAGSPTGNVVFRLGSLVQTVAVTGGVARATFTGTGTGSVSASADYTGNDLVMECCTATVRPGS